MTTSMPTGDGTVPDGPTRSEVDQDAAPTTGLEPDTAADAAGETTSTPAGAPADRTVLDGPALENQEMHRATDDLRSSQDKTAAAREIADELASTTQPDR
jgi:hypothetical protein